ncbi:threonine synthase [candidate division KSB1 bacterium]|nr:MAG: threonine synthase [candidate division KSB1 bacterium]
MSRMSFNNFSLICSNCEKEHDINILPPRCSSCNEPLEVRIKKIDVDRNIFKGREFSMWRYSEFIFTRKMISLFEGGTPLLKANRLSEYSGLKNIYLKNETVNPTGSFKDRGTAVGLNFALQKNNKLIGTLSTGNMAKSVAAYAAKAGVKAIVFVKDTISSEKINLISMFGQEIHRVKEDYGKLYFKIMDDYKDVFFINSDYPARIEGQKTIAYEICEQLNWDVPEYIVIPVSSGGNFSAIYKGFKEFFEAGFISTIPELIGVQAEGCSPIYKAYIQGKPQIEEFSKPHTIAHAIENPYPPSGNRVLKIVKENYGKIVAVNDEEIIFSQKLLSLKEGIFAQPASAAALGALLKLKDKRFFEKNDKIVLIITGMNQ